MSEEKKINAKELIGQLVCILLVLALLAGMIVAEVVRSNRSAIRRSVETAAYTHSDVGRGYVFRDEYVVETRNAGTMEYVTSDGTSVTTDTLIANVYGNDTGLDEHSLAAEYYEQIAIREQTLANMAGEWTDDYYHFYNEMMAALDAGDYERADTASQNLQLALSHRDTLADNDLADALRLEIAEYREKIEKLVRCESEPQKIYPDASGIFYRDTDGYEKNFDLNLPESLTPTDFTDLLSENKQDHSRAVGRIVNTDTYFVVLPVDLETSKSYLTGTAYNLYFTESDLNLTLTLSTINREDDRALLVFYGEGLPEALIHDRSQEIRIDRETVTGLRVPLTALSEIEGKTVVYVLEDGRAMPRYVRILLKENGCCLVASANDDAPLLEKDLVFVNANRVHSGKKVS